MIKPAKRTKELELSQIRKMFSVNDPNAINLGIGEPDFLVPDNIINKMKNATNENKCKYTPNKGYAELQEAIVNKLKKDNNIDTIEENIIITAGATEALHISAQAFFDKNDEIIIPNPGFLAYKAYAHINESKPIYVDVYEENNFKLKYEDIEKKITNKTKAIILNSPSNPTGGVIEKEDIKAIADLATDKNILIISDEIYEKIIYEGKHISPGAYSDNVITINGFSKAYCMTGLRIGYLNANEKLNDELLKIHQYCVACSGSLSQIGAIEALNGPQNQLKYMVKEFKNRRNLIVKKLNELGYPTVKSEGSFYVFPNVENGEKFTEKALNAGVITVPGIAFGSNGKEHVRMSFATSTENIKIAMERLEKI